MSEPRTIFVESITFVRAEDKPCSLDDLKDEFDKKLDGMSDGDLIDEFDKMGCEVTIELLGRNVRYRNDGKGKWQSWEASVQSENDIYSPNGGYGGFHFTGYGATKDDAIIDLKIMIRHTFPRMINN